MMLQFKFTSAGGKVALTISCELSNDENHAKIISSVTNHAQSDFIRRRDLLSVDCVIRSGWRPWGYLEFKWRIRVRVSRRRTTRRCLESSLSSTGTSYKEEVIQGQLDF